MACDGRFQQLLGFGEALNMVHIRVRRDQRDTLRKWKIKLPNNFKAIVDRILIADIDKRPIVVVVVDQINAATDPPPGLMIQLNDMREQRLTLQNGHANPSRQTESSNADDKALTVPPQPA
jgi:hypothetical protein